MVRWLRHRVWQHYYLRRLAGLPHVRVYELFSARTKTSPRFTFRGAEVVDVMLERIGRQIGYPKAYGSIKAPSSSLAIWIFGLISDTRLLASRKADHNAFIEF